MSVLFPPLVLAPLSLLSWKPSCSQQTLPAPDMEAEIWMAKNLDKEEWNDNSVTTMLFLPVPAKQFQWEEEVMSKRHTDEMLIATDAIKIRFYQFVAFGGY